VSVIAQVLGELLLVWLLTIGKLLPRKLSLRVLKQLLQLLHL